MNSNNQSPMPNQNEITSTAFRLPTKLLRLIDKWCEANDVTRSKFFRLSIVDRVKLLGIIGPAESNVDQLALSGVNSTTQTPNEALRRWSPELYERLQRGR